MKRYLILENGEVFEGEAIGAPGEQAGELVFTTNMCGYMETLTDPSYFGQIVIQTFPMIGNYGSIPQDAEGACAVSGYVVKELCKEPSNFRCVSSLNDFLIERGVCGIAGVDTRELTKILRERGVMNAAISDNPSYDLNALKNFSIKNAVKSVTGKDIITYNPGGQFSEKGVISGGDKESVGKKSRAGQPAGGNAPVKIALIDYGVKRNIVRELLRRGCEVTVFPAGATDKEILSYEPQGIMLSNGPGDPAENTEQVETLKKLLGIRPIFGICLGHQLLALANGGKTRKLKYGHRGANQPAKNLESGRTYITSQNHGYEVIADSVKNGILTYVNANDGSCEGMSYPGINAFSVQFHPEAAAGPKDTAFLFDEFLKRVKE